MVHKILRKFDMKILQICPPHLSDAATLPREIQKSHFSTSLFIYSRFTLPQKKTNSSCCTSTETLGVYLLSFSASYYLLSPGTASGACYRRSVCIATDMLSLAAVACCDIGWISAQRGVLRDWSVSKKTGSMYYCRRWSLNTCWLWHCLPVSCHKSQPVLFRAINDNPQLALFRASNVWKNTTNLQVRWKGFKIHKLVW